MAKTDKTGRSKSRLTNFLALERYLLQSPAWRGLDPVARAAYVEIAQAYDGKNNGRIVLSARMLADGLGVSKDTAARKLHTLQEHGFIEIVKHAAFNLKARHAAEYRLTAFRCDVTGAIPAKSFMRWQLKIQNTVRPQGPMVKKRHAFILFGPRHRTEWTLANKVSVRPQGHILESTMEGEHSNRL